MTYVVGRFAFISMFKYNCQGILIWSIFVLLSSINNVHGVDDGGLVEGCVENEIAFGCKREGTGIAIKEAWLHYAWHTKSSHKCQISEYNIQFKKGSVQHLMNKKCSLERSCRFNTWSDVPGAADDKKHWMGSVIRVQYECVKIKSIVEKCGGTVLAQRGWIQSIGYPSYYLGPGACTHTLTVDPGQKIELFIVDTSLREINHPADTQCTDRISVDEGNKNLLSTCGVSQKTIELMSDRHILNVTLHTSVEIYPKRGFLAFFRAVGCETPKIPEDGYLSHRNATHAEFWCCVRHVFPDSMSRIRKLTCDYKAEWNDKVPDCVDLDDLLLAGNITESEYKRYNGSISASMLSMKRQLITDIIIPAVLMGSLVIGNVGVLLLIVFCRRRALKIEENSEELDCIKVNAEMTDVRETQPCDV